MSLYQEYTVTLEHSESGNESIPRVHCISTMQSLLVASGLLRAKTTTVQSDRNRSLHWFLLWLQLTRQKYPGEDAVTI